MAAFVQLAFCTFAVLFVLVTVANVHLGSDHSDTESHKLIFGVGGALRCASWLLSYSASIIQATATFRT